MPSYDCPNCASPAVQAYSELGYEYACPERKGMGCAGWLCILIAFGGTNAAVMIASMPGIAGKVFAIVFGVVAACFAYLAFRQSRVASRYNKDQHPLDVAQWKQSYRCHRCGHNFFFR